MIRSKREYEKVKVDEWIEGTVDEIQYDMKHQFTKTEAPAVKVKLRLKGYKYPKSTPWLLFSYSKTSNLYAMFIDTLVEGAYPNMDFDFDQLKNFKIKVMFEQNGDYQNIVLMRPLESKLIPVIGKTDESSGEAVPEDEVPF